MHCIRPNPHFWGTSNDENGCQTGREVRTAFISRFRTFVHRWKFSSYYISLKTLENLQAVTVWLEFPVQLRVFRGSGSFWLKQNLLSAKIPKGTCLSQTASSESSHTFFRWLVELNLKKRNVKTKISCRNITSLCFRECVGAPPLDGFQS